MPDFADIEIENLMEYLVDMAELMNDGVPIEAVTIGDALNHLFDNVIMGNINSNDDLNGGLFVGIGDDKIFGLSGDDTIDGGWGDDILHGGKGNFVTQIGEDYLVSSDNFASHIIIKNNTDDQPLGLQLRVTNAMPEIGEVVPDQLFTADDSFSLALSDDLFVDPDGDELIYSLTLADGSPLPDWLSFDHTTNTLSGTPPQGADISVKVIATDPSGEAIEQSFNIKSNARPTLNEALQPVLYLQAADSDWQYALPNNTFTDADGDALSYTLAMADGSEVPTAITIEAATGILHADATQLATTGETATIFDVNVIATDTHGAQVSSLTQLYITEALVEAEAGLTSGGFGDDVILSSNGETHLINGLIGNDTIYGADQKDTLNGGLGNDILYGNAGDDSLNGGVGNDTLIGGMGNDVLKGGLGDDTYIFNQGDGQDTLRDFAGDDTLMLSQFSLADLVVGLQGNDLVIEFDGQDANNTDSLTVKNWDTGGARKGYHIETIELTNTSLTDEQLTAMIG